MSALAAYLLESPRWDLVFGWLAIWGWAGMIVHGMLTRIIPFLVWLDRFASRVGEIPVPSVKKLLPDQRTRVGFALHLGTLVMGVVAIGGGWDWLSRLTGLALMATAAWIFRAMIHVLLVRPAS